MHEFDINAIQLKIQAPEITITEELNNYILQQIEKQGKFFNRISKCEMILRFENNRKHTCEADIKIYVPGTVLFASGMSTEFPPAIAEAFHEIHDQLIKYKDKIRRN